MSEQLIPWAAWAGLIVLAILCLPIGSCQKFVLAIASWALRLTLLAVLAGGAYLYFRPGDIPARVTNILNDFPGLMSLLPDRAAPHFALCLACLVVAVLLPFLMVLDVTWALAGRRLRRIRALTDGPVEAVATGHPLAEPVPVAEPDIAPVGVPVLRPIDRRTASTTITTAGSRGPAARR
jgi:hypothetical protein